MYCNPLLLNALIYRVGIINTQRAGQRSYMGQKGMKFEQQTLKTERSKIKFSKKNADRYL